MPENVKVNSIKGVTNNDYALYLENGFKILGGFFNVPTQSTKIFEIKYTLKKEDGYYFPLEEVKNEITYNLNIFKQPGTDKDPIRVTVTYPESWAATSQGDFERLINQLTLQTDLRSDRNYRLEWQYK